MNVPHLQSATYTAALPGRFACLMELYEENYLLIEALLERGVDKELNVFNKQHRKCGSLRIEILEKSAWTTTLGLIYTLDQPLRHGLNIIDVKVRVYHDTRQASLLMLTKHLRAYLEARRRAGDLMTNWYLNRFLYRALKFFFNHTYKEKIYESGN